MLDAKFKNTMREDSFCLLILISGVVSWWIFVIYLFVPLFDIGVNMSLIMFAVFQIVFSYSIGALLFKKYRTPQNAILISLIPSAIHYCFFERNIADIILVVVWLGILYVMILGLSLLFEKLRRKDPFEKLTYQQRLAFLRYVLKKELAHLDVCLPIRLVPSDRLSVGTLASYCPATGIISINKSLLMQEKVKGAELCAILAHEAQHALAFQNLLSVSEEFLATMDAEDQFAVKLIQREFVDYKSASKHGFQRYRRQIIERMARFYAKERRNFYIKYLSAIVAEVLDSQSKRERHGG